MRVFVDKKLHKRWNARRRIALSCVSADGSTFALCLDDRAHVVYNTFTGECVQEIENQDTGWFSCFGLSHSGKYLIVHIDAYKARAYDVSSGLLAVEAGSASNLLQVDSEDEGVVELDLVNRRCVTHSQFGFARAVVFAMLGSPIFLTFTTKDGDNACLSTVFECLEWQPLP